MLALNSDEANSSKIFLIYFSSESEDDIDICESYRSNSEIEKIQVLSPEDKIIPPFFEGDGLPIILDLKIKVRLMDIDKYNAFSTEEYNVNIETERTKQSLCPFLIQPIESLGLVSQFQFIDCIHNDTLKLYLRNYSLNSILIQKGQIICNLYESIRSRGVLLASKLIYDTDFILSDNFVSNNVSIVQYKFKINITRNAMSDDIIALYELGNNLIEFGIPLYMPYDVTVPPRGRDGLMGRVNVDFGLYGQMFDHNHINNTFIVIQSNLVNTPIFSPANIFSRYSCIIIQFNNLSDEPIILQKGFSYNRVYSYTKFVPIMLSIQPE